jgi:hypothetical protein
MIRVEPIARDDLGAVAQHAARLTTGDVHVRIRTLADAQARLARDLAAAVPRSSSLSDRMDARRAQARARHEYALAVRALRGLGVGA